MSETTTETTTTADDAATAEPTIESLTAEVAKFKALSRKHEDRAKANHKAAQEQEAARLAAMTEQERAVAEAISKARADAVREFGTRSVLAEFRAAAAGRLTDEQVAELTEDLDMSKYLTEDGEVDAERIQRKVAALAPAPPDESESETETTPTWPSLGQGRPSTTPEALALNGDPLLKALKAKVGAR